MTDRGRARSASWTAHLIAFACSAAPEGHTHWTLQLLADKVVELEFAESISLETVRPDTSLVAHQFSKVPCYRHGTSDKRSHCMYLLD